MAKKQNLSYKARKTELLSNRMLVVFVLLTVAIFSLVSLKNWLDSPESLDYLQGYMDFAPFFPIVPLVLFILAGVYFFINKKSKKDETFKLFSSSFILTVAGILLFLSFVISQFPYMGIAPSIIFVIMVSLLYFVAISFPGAYLVIAVFNALGAFLLYFLKFFSPVDNGVMLTALRIIIISVSVAFLVLITLSKKGTIPFMKSVVERTVSLFPIYFAVILFIAFVVLSMLGIGSYLIYDLIIVLETIVFALFYAIKMLK